MGVALFLGGCFVGVLIGGFVMALCSVAKDRRDLW